jgi:hypothetical protein
VLAERVWDVLVEKEDEDAETTGDEVKDEEQKVDTSCHYGVVPEALNCYWPGIDEYRS